VGKMVGEHNETLKLNEASLGSPSGPRQ
jgi:hypothetical protein